MKPRVPPPFVQPTVHVYQGPEVPIAYDSDWQLFTNLTSAQIAWFQAQPEWQQFVRWVNSSPTSATIHADKGS